ncbi:(2Fe-2S)-binding protein [Pararhodobacter oceanensis]|uniref:(2Fe-2S)-binding protein n=1 Tax=Pararhodobacter oceanensis TaxID=2172121 RepID=UPI003A8E2FFA
MTIDSRFLPRPDAGALLHMTLDGAPITARAGDTLAAAILAASDDASRHSTMGTPRTAYCMMGVCFDCLIEVDGQPNTQACMVAARDGMVLARQNGARGLRKLSSTPAQSNTDG